MFIYGVHIRCKFCFITLVWWFYKPYKLRFGCQLSQVGTSLLVAIRTAASVFRVQFPIVSTDAVWHFFSLSKCSTCCTSTYHFSPLALGTCRGNGEPLCLFKVTVQLEYIMTSNAIPYQWNWKHVSVLTYIAKWFRVKDPLLCLPG